MSSRHTRRKTAKAKQQAKLGALARAERSRQIAATVRANKSAPRFEKTVTQVKVNFKSGAVTVAKTKSAPIERNYYPPSNMGRLAELSHRAYVCRPSRAGPSAQVTGFWHPPRRG